MKNYCVCEDRVKSGVTEVEKTSRELSKYEEAMRKKDERRVRLQIERDAMLVVIGLLVEKLAQLRKSYEKDSNA